MKKIFIGATVGGIIIFLWQFLSWSVINIHSSMQTYSPKQQEVLTMLGENLEEGFYFMPTLPNGASQEESQKLMKDVEGKPWAQVYYHKSWNTSMGMNFVRGIIANIVAVLLLCWILIKMGNPSFQTIVLSSISIGILSYITTSYTNSIWYQTHSLPDLIDGMVQWGLTGLWLGWWLRR